MRPKPPKKEDAEEIKIRENFDAEKDHSEVAYVNAESLPDVLVRVAKEAGFYASSTSIQAIFPSAFQYSANRSFRRLLKDWASGTLSPHNNYVPEEDTKYKKWLKQKFKIPSLTKQAVASQGLKNFQGIRCPRFGDYARLRSGRDDFSKMNLESLGEKTDEKLVQEL